MLRFFSKYEQEVIQTKEYGMSLNQQAQVHLKFQHQ